MKKHLNIIIRLLVVVVGLLFAGFSVSDMVGGRSSIYTDTGGLLDVNKNEIGTTTPTFITTYASVDVADVIANKAKIEYNLSGDNGAVTLEVAA